MNYNLNFRFVKTKGVNIPSQVLCTHYAVPRVGETVVVHWRNYYTTSDRDFHRQAKGKVVNVVHSVYEQDYNTKGCITVFLKPIT